MQDNTSISLYISIGGFIISCLGFLNTIRQSKYNRKIERLRTYDKIYFDVCDLLLFDYKIKSQKAYVSEDKDLEQAVNQFGQLHWMEQIYGPDSYGHIKFKNKSDQVSFSKKVSEEYYKFQREKSSTLLGNQSPVMHTDNEEFNNRFKRVMAHIKENISLFSKPIRLEWEKTNLREPDEIRKEYISLERVNSYACEELEEKIDDPYLKIFLLIRQEHRILNKQSTEKLLDTLFNLKWRISKSLIKINEKMLYKFNSHSED
ncbi:hypothetical protein LAD51_22730 [Klebsiella pneumoniae]|uniref:hypothetical protein n=1 Tax=Klebsiella pneumoniae TaxID=573 RepID=UPI0022710ABA|nr:hypothetical protein [Klebsiella pneumoniae]MCX9860109.1 hypothetical protein [Klebsiella pneumoniae]MCX9870421.1 hypothetical protein [Klebsiella pneumoniae]